MIPASTKTVHADHRRGGRTAAVAGRLGWTERLVAPDRRALPGGAIAVCVGSAPERWAISYPDATLVVDLGGTHELAVRARRWQVVLEGDALRFGNRCLREGYDAYTELPPLAPFDTPGIEVVSSVHDDRWTTAVLRMPPRSAPVLALRGWFGDELDGDVWGLDLPGLGSAAITDDDHVAVAMLDRTLRVVCGERRRWAPAELAVATLPHEPFAVTAHDDGFTVLCAVEDRPPDAATRHARLFGGLVHDGRATWHTHVRRFSRAGALVWSADVPFAAVQPAIDLGDGRVAIVGRGVAVVDAGRVQWLRHARRIGYAAAWCDGSLALALAGSVLQLDGLGATVQQLALPEGAEATAPPAIAADGTLLLACTTGVMLAR